MSDPSRGKPFSKKNSVLEERAIDLLNNVFIREADIKELESFLKRYNKDFGKENHIDLTGTVHETMDDMILSLEYKENNVMWICFCIMNAIFDKLKNVNEHEVLPSMEGRKCENDSFCLCKKCWICYKGYDIRAFRKNISYCKLFLLRRID